MTANVYGEADRVRKAGDSMSGTLVLNGAPPVQVPASAANGKVLTSDAAGNAAWQTLPAGLQLDTTATDIQPLGTQAAGATGKAADAGHVHAMPRLDQVSAPTAAVALNSQKITGLANGAAATDAAAFGQIPVIDATSTDIKALGTQAAGSTGKVADAGHVHPMPTLNQIGAPTAAVAMGSQKITGLANGSAATDAAAFGQIPVIDATATDIKALGTQAAGSTGKVADAGHVHPMPTLNQVGAPTAAVAMGSQKITGLANGSASSDAAAFGQIPVLGAANGAASLDSGGHVPTSQIPDLSGTYLTLANYGNTWMPSDHGFIAWTMDPALTSANGTTLSSGYIYMLEVILRQAATINKIDVVVGVAGATLTAGQCLAGLYTTSGTRVGITADQSTNWTTAGDKQMALTSSYSAAAGKYFIALLMNGTGTSPTFACGSTLGAAFTPGNAGLAAGSYRFMRSASGQTALPTSVTLSGYTPDANNVYAAVL